MTIGYLNGRSVQGILVARTETTICMLAEGSQDMIEVSNINGIWVSADCEPVSIDFELDSQHYDRKPAITDGSCSQELAARILHFLFPGRPEETFEIATDAEPLSDLGCSRFRV